MVDNPIELSISHRDSKLDISVSNDSTVHDLALQCAAAIAADVERISLFILPKPGLLKHPFSEQALSDILSPTVRIKLIGTPTKDVHKLDEVAAQIAARAASRRVGPRVTVNKNRDWRKVQEESQYTFHKIEPLPYLPDPEKSRRFLERLADDAGIKASMRKHKFSVGLLTEMNPAEHTTHDGKTLGLNRNKGQVIELRLRTDRYDGYRDYKVIRKTLCHELSHNIWSDHDRNFWDLTKQIEDEVEKNDWRRGGHKLTSDEFYNPGDDDEGVEHADAGGWVGGEFVLGGLGTSEDNSTEGLNRRELMARAAMQRIKKQQEPNDKHSDPGHDQHS